MTVDGGWHWYLKQLPERAKGCYVEFNVIERDIGSRIPRRVWEWDNRTIATRIGSSDTLIGILFEESLKSKGISLIDEEEIRFLGNSAPKTGLCITIVLSQMTNNITNINAEVLDLLSKVLDSEWRPGHDA